MPASKTDLQFGQVWRFYLTKDPMMYIGPVDLHFSADPDRHSMLILGRDDSSVSTWSTLRSQPQNWTLLEDVDAND